MEIRVHLVADVWEDIGSMVEGLRKIEKEYSCNCTLLEVIPRGVRTINLSHSQLGCLSQQSEGLCPTESDL